MDQVRYCGLEAVLRVRFGSLDQRQLCLVVDQKPCPRPMHCWALLLLKVVLIVHQANFILQS